MHLCLPPSPPSSLGCCPFYGGGSVVVDSFLIDALIEWFCVCSMCYCALLCVISRFAIVLIGEERGCCFTLLVCLVSYNCYCSVALPDGAVDCSG